MIPNIVYGKGISGALAYVMGQGNDAKTGDRLELVPGEKSRAILLGGQGFGFDIDSPERLELARRVMEWQGLPENQGSKTRKQELDCLHASLSWHEGYQPSRAEMLEAATDFLKAIGLEKARAVFVAHDDTDHAHIHIVASRIDPETGKTLRVDYDKAEAQKWAVAWERAHGQERTAGEGLHPLRDAVEARDVAAVQSYLTRDKATFQTWEINRALQYGGLDGEARDKFRAEIIGDKNTIGLRDQAEGPVTRYTTRQVLADEMAVLRHAATLSGDHRPSLTQTLTDEIGARLTLKPEQAEAVTHLTGSEGFAILWGEAGTGKSHTLNAVREGYAKAGRDVIGLSWTNDVVQQMRSDGFKKAATVSSELTALEQGRDAWSKNTVVIVDESAMLSTAALSRVMEAAKDAGAKLILAGDDAQLSSIERGGMFETLRQNHGAAILSEVQRVKDSQQQAAFNQMHKGEFAEALQTFDKAGGIHWTTRQSDALKDMATRYTADVAADPAKKRFMFAATNVDVRDLNEQARELHRARGDLGRDHELRTKHGLQNFAEGDRIQFTANGRTQREKNAGLTNGRVGTVESITYDDRYRPHVKVALDVGRHEAPRSVTFVVGDNEKAGEFSSFRHGYAGTIYRGQGRTLDQTYIAYTQHMRASSAYVALTRHRETVQIFAARETVKDLDAMARAMSRRENKRAATAYRAADAEIMAIHKALEAAEERRRTASGFAAGAEKAAEIAARLVEGTLDRVATSVEGLLGGAPSPGRELTAKEKREARLKAQLEANRQEAAARLEEIARQLGQETDPTEDRSQSRDRGGGHSL